MVKVRVENIKVLDQIAPITAPFKFEIVFEALEMLDDDLEWKMIYVGSPEETKYDQLLESVLVGPIPCGGDAPNWKLVPAKDILGYTAVLITCNYKQQEFCRIGYFVINDYTDEEFKESIPLTPVIEKIQRYIVLEEPRVTIFPIRWNDSDPLPPITDYNAPELRNMNIGINGTSLNNNSQNFDCGVKNNLQSREYQEEDIGGEQDDDDDEDDEEEDEGEEDASCSLSNSED